MTHHRSTTAAASALLLLALVTPLHGRAGLLSIFQPKTFTPVAVSADWEHFRLPDASEFGTQRQELKPHTLDVQSLAQAQSEAGFALMRSSTVPAGIERIVTYRVQTPARYSYRFSAKKARAYEARRHVRLPAMPPGLDGTTIHVAFGSVVFAAYGKRISESHRSGFERDGRQLLFVQARAPQVTSTGASLSVMENYLLALPGIPARLAAEIRALGDLSQTLPIPIRPDKQTSKPVTIHGAPGLAVGDDTGLGAGVIWEKNGIIYGVAGPQRESDVLAFADGVE